MNPPSSCTLNRASHPLATQHEADVFAMLLGWTALGCIFFSVIAFLSLLS